MRRLRRLRSLKFVNKTDSEKIEALACSKKGSADVTGIRLLGVNPDEVPEVFQDKLQWTPKGVFTHCKAIAKQLVETHNGVYVEDNVVC